jgi:DNA-directed RNA polymerase subunit RPC12/RpoP
MEQTDQHAEARVEYLCDRCGAPMAQRKCKIICENCGATRDCSDP